MARTLTIILLAGIAISEGCDTESVPTQVFVYNDGTTRYISSPDYPYDYPSHQVCWWRIRNMGSNLDIHDRIGYATAADLDIQQSPLCNSTDYLEIYDTTPSKTKLASICGQGGPYVGYSQRGGDLLIHFRADASTQYKGFRMGFSLNNIPNVDSIAVPGSVNIGTIVGILAGVVTPLAVITIACVCSCFKKGSKGRRTVRGTGPACPIQQTTTPNMTTITQGQSVEAKPYQMNSMPPEQYPNQPQQYQPQPHQYPPPTNMYPPFQGAAYPPPPAQYPPGPPPPY